MLRGILFCSLVAAALVDVNASNETGSPVRIQSGPNYASMHDHGWMTIRNDVSNFELQVAGLPGATATYPGALSLVNHGREARLAWLEQSQPAPEPGLKIDWTFVGEGFTWHLANKSTSPAVVLQPGQELVLSIVMDWRAVEASARPISFRVYSDAT